MSGEAEIPRRAFKDGIQVSALALGGSHLGDVTTESEAERIVHQAIDAGLDFFDNAWEYHDGLSEDRMGRALQGRRDRVFLMTKVCSHGRGRDVALKQLEESLKRLKTDYIDLWQVHEVVYDNDPDLHFAKGGVIEALDAAKQSGKVRYVGFTGHKDPEIHLKMLSFGYPFDTVQMPLNPFDATFRSFQKRVLPELKRRDIAAIGMKSMGGNGQPVKKKLAKPEELLRYAMSLDVLTTVSGIDSLEVLEQNLRVARGFQPMSDDEMRALERRVAGPAGDGRVELYKSSKLYDANVGREQHDFPSVQELSA
jgi:aryl-alcohol dehydrogenase-like predicted oxidoreductase